MGEELVPTGRLSVATTVEEALAALRDGGASARPVAGATWIMRAPIRGEELGSPLIAISRIPELRGIDVARDAVRIGACATHAELCRALGSLPEFSGLATAAASSANPVVRNVATLGGNLCTVSFPASDLIAALLVLDAEVEVVSPEGAHASPVPEFLARRASLAGGSLVTAVRVRRSGRRSAHARLPLRKAGDYPVAIVSVAAEVGKDGSVRDVRVAVGSVEDVARRWEALERALEGLPLAPRHAAERARDLTASFEGRDEIEAPGWYRVAVLPSLVRRAFESLQEPALDHA